MVLCSLFKYPFNLKVRYLCTQNNDASYENRIAGGIELYFETITYERNERFCPVLQKNVLMDVNEKNCGGCTTINVKCCNENQCSKQFGKCTNTVIQGL